MCIFIAGFCIVIYYPSLDVSVGSLCLLASLLDSIAKNVTVLLREFGGGVKLAMPEFCWCCCNSLDVDKKNHGLTKQKKQNWAITPTDVKLSKDDVPVDSDRERNAERQSIWLQAVSGHMDLWLTQILDSSIRSLFTRDTLGSEDLSTGWNNKRQRHLWEHTKSC